MGLVLAPLELNSKLDLGFTKPDTLWIFLKARELEISKGNVLVPSLATQQRPEPSEYFFVFKISQISRLIAEFLFFVKLFSIFTGMETCLQYI